jgi:hypothetical protein
MRWRGVIEAGLSFPLIGIAIPEPESRRDGLASLSRSFIQFRPADAKIADSTPAGHVPFM